jgi:23S rRNA pseudouridine2605 synthase/23S rRNA pseudouridine2604 synthase
MAEVRLQKFLSEAGYCSRRRGEVLIQEGRVRVNGQVVTVLGTRVDPETDDVAVDGRSLEPDGPRIYIALNKPAGYVSSCRHTGKRLVVDLVDIGRRIFPVGRLDEDSEGLLIMTNDGPLHNRLSHPSFDHEKEYDVTVAAPLTDRALREMATGVLLEGRRTRPATVRRLGSRRFRITLQEGRNRQIRRMVAHTGNTVTALRRIRFANIRLGNLAPGRWRYLTPAEKRELLKMR